MTPNAFDPIFLLMLLMSFSHRVEVISKLLLMTEQNYHDVRRQLEKARLNERIYKDKINDINLTRTHVAD